MANTLEYIFILSFDLLKYDYIGTTIIIDGETEAQRNYLTHQSYKATKSQSHSFIQQLFPTGLLCAQPSGDPTLKENVSMVIRVLPGGGQAGS